MWTLCVIVIQLPKVNNSPIGENSSCLVPLIARATLKRKLWSTADRRTWKLGNGKRERKETKCRFLHEIERPPFYRRRNRSCETTFFLEKWVSLSFVHSNVSLRLWVM
jgi:hypothetical protein